MATIGQWIARLIAFYWFVICQIWFWLSVRTFATVKRRFRKELDPERRRHWRAYDRLDYDLPGAEYFWLWIGSLTLFPIRFPVFLGVAVCNVLGLMAFSSKCTLDVTLECFDKVTTDKLPPRVQHDQKTQQVFMRLLRWLVTSHCATELWLMGIWTIREWKVLNNRFDFDQFDREALLVEPLSEEDKKEIYQTRCFVSNHVSVADSLFLITRLFPSFLAKSSVFTDPLIGPCARALNCVFLNRRSSADRERTIRVIDERQCEIWKQSMSQYADPSAPGDPRIKLSPILRDHLEYARKIGCPVLDSKPSFTQKVPPLLVFPEGTTSSGRHLIPLKRGAFLGLRPVTPVVLIYRFPGFGLSFDVMPIIWSAPLILSNLRLATLDAYWLQEVLPPAPWMAAYASSGSTDTQTAAVSCSSENTLPSCETAAATQVFCQDVWIRMSRVLSTMCHWEMPQGEDLPFSWNGTMQAKLECVKYLFR